MHEWDLTDRDFDSVEFSESVLTAGLRDPAWQKEITDWYTE